MSKSLFGTTTEEDIQHITAVIRENRNYNNKIINHVNGLLSIGNHSNSEIQQNRNRLNLITNVTRGVIQHINSVTSVTINRLSTSMKAIKVNLMFEHAINSLEDFVAEIDNQRQLYERHKIQIEAKQFTQELLSSEELYRILNVHNGGDIAT